MARLKNLFENSDRSISNLKFKEMNNSNNNTLGTTPNKRKKAYTQEQINALPDQAIAGNLMKFASFLKNNLNIDYPDAMKKARPLVDTDEGLALIRKIKAQNGQQVSSLNSVAPVDLNQPYTELPEASKERQQEIKLKEPVKVQGIRPKNITPTLLEPFTSNYFLLLDIIPDLEQRLKEQDLEEVSQRLDEDILDLVFSYAYQNEDGTHMVNMIQPDGEDEDLEPDLIVLLKVDPIRKMVEVISYTDHNGNTHKVYSEIDNEIHTNHSMKKRLNENLTEWLKGFIAQAHKIETLEEQREEYVGSFQYYKDGCEDLENFYAQELEKNRKLTKEIERLESLNESIEDQFYELDEKYEKIIEIMKPLMDEMIGETVIYNGRKQVIETEIGFFRYLAHILKVKDNKKR